MLLTSGQLPLVLMVCQVSQALVGGKHSQNFNA